MSTAHEDLVSYIQSHTDKAMLYEHMQSKTSEESMEARKKASGEEVVGAKALLLKVDVKDKEDVFVLVVLPGFNKLDSKTLKQELKNRIPGARNFRFATPEEMDRVARGMQPGKMPPFGKPIFPQVSYTFIDEAMLGHEKLGFNAAHFEKSFIMPTTEYMKMVVQDGVFPCSTELVHE